MKVVLFCGGLGMRLREYSDSIPKPMVTIGYRPIVWHLMKYYAHFGHKDFILCLGHKGDVIKNYFLKYDECLSNDFTLSNGGRTVALRKTDIDDWNITFVDTGLTANIGQRLRAVESYLDGQEMFLANYSDGLTDLCLPNLMDHYLEKGKIAAFLAVKPQHSFHVVDIREDGHVEDIQDLSKSGIWINVGFFVLRKEIFQYLREGEELVHEPFQRLLREEQLIAYKYEGFWKSMDTFKDKQQFDEMQSNGETPWELWKMPSQEVSPPKQTPISFVHR